MSSESFSAPVKGLPPRRDDIKFDTLAADAAEMLAKARLIVLTNFFDAEQTAAIKASTRRLLVAHAPIRAFRKLLDKTVQDSVTLPRLLRRAPLQVQLAKSAILGASTRAAIEQVEAVNAELYEFPVLEELYGSSVHELSHGLLNLTPKGKWFAKHQDSKGVRGFGFACQTADTLWHVEPSLTHPDEEDFTFETHAGDVVVLRERIADLDPVTVVNRGVGFDEYIEDGSVVHTGLNLDPNRLRYTLNLFSTEFMEV
jgi:hypothetical protein